MSPSTFRALLWVIAVFTLVAGLVGMLPRKLVCQRLPLDRMDEAGWLFFRHWALLVLLCGLLLVWGALSPSVQPPLLLLVAGEKIGFALIVLRQRHTPLGRALRPGAVADFFAALVLLAGA